MAFRVHGSLVIAVEFVLLFAIVIDYCYWCNRVMVTGVLVTEYNQVGILWATRDWGDGNLLNCPFSDTHHHQVMSTGRGARREK